MKLFFKHLIRSIRKRPLQPLIIILTIALSVMVCASALTIKQSVADELNASNEAVYGSSDIVIKLNSSSKSRFMFDTEAEKILGDNANSVGTYELIFSLNDDTVFAKAVDFKEIDTVFDFYFTEYGEIKEEEISHSAVITERLASEHDISLGEIIKLELFGKMVEYEVSAISKAPFFNSSDIMVDISGVMEALASESIFISVLDDIKPYSTIYIDVNDNERINECVNLLGKSEAFSDKNIVVVSENINNGLVEVTLPLVINLCIVLCCFLAMVVVFNSIFILSKQRTEENDTFIAIGTKKITLNLLQYAEVFLYWLIGAPIGILLAYPSLFVAGRYLSFKYAREALSIQNALLSMLLIFGIAILTATVFVITRGNIKHGRKKGIATLILFMALSLSFVLTFLSRGKWSTGLGIFTAFLLLAFVFFSTPYLISKLLDLIFKLDEKRRMGTRRVKHVSLYYALKNLKSIEALKNTTRLISSIVIVALVASMLVGASHGNLNATKKFFDGDYIVLNATHHCYEEIIKSENAKEVSRVYQSTASYENGYLTLVTSTSNIDAFGDHIKISELPKGNEAVISETDARSLNLNLGDELKVKLEGKSVTLVVKEIVETGTTAVIIDSESLGISPNMLLVEAEEGKESELLSEITLLSSNELSTIISAQDLRNDKIESNTSILRCANMLLCIIILYSVIGILNNLYESYRSRKEELALYHYAGISNAKIAKMIISELLVVLLIGVFVGLLGTLVCALSIDKSLAQLNCELISYLKYLF